MGRAVLRRSVLRGLVVAGVSGLGGCSIEGLTGGGDGGGSGSGTPTREPLTWAEATREVLGQSEVETLRAAGLPPGDVGTRGEAERAFAAVGWRQGVAGLDGGQLGRIDDLLARASDTRGTLSRVESTLARLDSVVRRMKDTDIPLTGATVWEAATTSSPSLRGFDATLDRSLDEVRTWLALLEDVTASLGAARDTIGAVRDGRIQQAPGLADQVDRALSAIDDLESRSRSLRQSLSESAEVTGQVADVSGQLGPMAGEVGDTFGEASSRLASAASELRQFNDRLRAARSALSDLRSRARQRSSELLSRAEELVGPGATADGADGGSVTATPTTATPTETPTPQPPGVLSDPELVEGFEDGVGEWGGDTGKIEGSADAARGDRAVRLAPGYTDVHFDLPPGTGGTYSIWWKAESGAGALQILFQDRGGATGFGGAVQPGTSGLEVAVNPEFVGGSSATLYSGARAGAWYRLAFTSVDFGRGTFEASLYDAGDVELTRIQQSFAGEVGSVGRMAVRNTGDEGGAFLDHLVVTPG